MPIESELGRLQFTRGIHILSIGEHNFDLGLAVATTEDELRSRRETMKTINGPANFEEVKFGQHGQILLISREGLKVSTEISRSSTSEAVYLARSEFSSPAIWIQHLEEGAQTSLHYHARHSESYYPIFGQSSVEVGDKFNNKHVRLERGIEVKPWTTHRVRGGEGGSIIAIVTTGSENCFDMTDHNYVESHEDFVKNHLPLKPADI